MKVLVVDGDRVMADVIAYALQREGYQVIQAYDGLSALQRWEEDRPDLLIMDVNLPKLDGYSVCRQVRAHADIPIIFLSVRCDDTDVIQGLELGADAYMSKPFSPRQLVARVQALFRRTAPLVFPIPVGQNGAILQVDTIEVAGEHGRRVHLTPLEGRLYEFLAGNAGRVQSCEAIINHVWGYQAGNRDQLRQLVHRLRDKIETDPALPIRIRTIPGQGYTLAEPPERS